MVCSAYIIRIIYYLTLQLHLLLLAIKHQLFRKGKSRVLIGLEYVSALCPSFGRIAPFAANACSVALCPAIAFMAAEFFGVRTLSNVYYAALGPIECATVFTQLKILHAFRARKCQYANA